MRFMSPVFGVGNVWENEMGAERILAALLERERVCKLNRRNQLLREKAQLFGSALRVYGKEQARREMRLWFWHEQQSQESRRTSSMGKRVWDARTNGLGVGIISL